MREPVVADSACLIALEQIDCLDILPALYEPVSIPPAVDREAGTAAEWLVVAQPTNTALVNSLRLTLDAGEAEAIALAAERGIRVILDDRQARAVAKGLNVPLIGTIGCLLKAKQAGAIAAVRPLIEKLEAHHFYLAAALKAEALRLAGE